MCVKVNGGTGCVVHNGGECGTMKSFFVLKNNNLSDFNRTSEYITVHHRTPRFNLMFKKIPLDDDWKNHWDE